MIDGIWKVFPSRMRLATLEVAMRISIAATRPPPIFLHRVWVMTPLRLSLSIIRICSCRSAGNWSMIRSTVLGAVLVWSVPNTR